MPTATARRRRKFAGRADGDRLPQNFGAASGVVVVIEDLSELISAQRASAWAEVARRMAHEIKNPSRRFSFRRKESPKTFKRAPKPKAKSKFFTKPEDRNHAKSYQKHATILREVNS
jgi:hypothetical protein